MYAAATASKDEQRGQGAARKEITSGTRASLHPPSPPSCVGFHRLCTMSYLYLRSLNDLAPTRLGVAHLAYRHSTFTLSMVLRGGVTASRTCRYPTLLMSLSRRVRSPVGMLCEANENEWFAGVWCGQGWLSARPSFLLASMFWGLSLEGAAIVCAAAKL